LGRVHQLFERADDGHDVAGEFLLVVAEIGLLGDLPPLAQGIQHFVDGRLGLQELRIHLEQVAIGAVEELDTLVRPEDHDAGAEALQHVGSGASLKSNSRRLPPTTCCWLSDCTMPSFWARAAKARAALLMSRPERAASPGGRSSRRWKA